MKKSILFIGIIVFTSFISLGQKADLETVESFWKTNISAMISLDKEMIIEQTNFPLEGSWGYAIGLDGDAQDWTKEDYTSNLNLIYTDEVRIKLRGLDHNHLVHHKDAAGELNFILQLNFVTVSDGPYESATLFYFKRFDGVWKLFQIEYAG